MSPTWLRNATFVGSGTHGGEEDILCWDVKGLQTNEFCQYKGQRAPLEIKQGGTDTTIYNTSTFDESPIPLDIFDLPGECTNKCGGACRFV